ncbi:hypothetical protein HK101_007297 [Irineochytrium annulatum]|nr:hypothetical protein HK101_007297 [Irineochytrium annulatum]
MSSTPRSSRPPFRADDQYIETQPPRPDWTPPTTPRPPAHRVNLDKEESIDPTGAYSFLISAVTPRPIALVSTISTAGITNVVPFSYYTLLCHDPPVLVLSINYNRGGQPKDTLRNMEGTGEFVVNSFNEHLVENANYCSGNFPSEVDESVKAGLEMVESRRVGVKRITKLRSDRDGKGALASDGDTPATAVVLGQIINVIAKSDVLTKEKTVDPSKYAIVSRLGGSDYGRTMQAYSMDRPKIQ